MRRFALLLWLATALTLIPHSLHAADPPDYKQAEKLAWEEQYDAAIAMVTPLPDDESQKYDALRVLCQVYTMRGETPAALGACAQALQRPLYQTVLQCVNSSSALHGTIKRTPECSGDLPYPEVSRLKAWQAISMYRHSGLSDDVSTTMRTSVFIHNRFGGHQALNDVLIAYLTNLTGDAYIGVFKRNYLAAGKDTAELERLRLIIVYGGAGTPLSRAFRSARVLYAEHPYGKPALLGFGAILLAAALAVPARGPLRRLARGMAYAARNVPRRINTWLHPSARPATPYSPATAPASGIPLYYTMRYPNQAYRIAGYCFAAFWILFLGPLSLALLLPAFTLLADFSVSGFQKAYSHFFGILSASVTWARLWFALLLFSLLGFVGFKLYGRFSLPKPMRPPIRFIYGTLVFAFLSTILTAVGTFLAYFTAAFTGLYSNPLVKTLISILRKMLGF